MQRFSVTGMSCAACSAHVERAVAAVPGVRSVAVSLLTNSMQVDYAPGADPDAVNTAILDAVAAAGYGAAAAGADLLVIDQNEEKVREMRELTDNALVVHGLDKKTLEETGIQNCDVAVVCIGEHMESSILTTLNLVDMGVPKVISKATSAEHGEILRRLGAEVVYPERDMAIRLAKRLASRRILDFIQLSEKINITKLEVPEKLIGRSVADSDLRRRFGFNVIAIVKTCTR